MAEVVTNHEVAGMREQHSFHNIRSSQLERKDLDDIYQFGDALKATVDTYVSLKS